jgi:hypothetical protein
LGPPWAANTTPGTFVAEFRTGEGCRPIAGRLARGVVEEVLGLDRDEHIDLQEHGFAARRISLRRIVAQITQSDDPRSGPGG